MPHIHEGLHIALVGDYSPQVPAHQAIPIALQRVAADTGLAVTGHWVATPEVGDGQRLLAFDAIWCVPASPYRDMHGALTAIRLARENRRPFLGTCGGFQHALIEFARHQLGWHDAEHAETSPAADNVIIAPLSCSLVDVLAPIRLIAGTLIAEAYGTLAVVERYQCRYGLREDLRHALFADRLRPCAVDEQGAVRAVQLQEHPFFVATLFQPERAALQGLTPPLVQALVLAAAHQRRLRTANP